MYAQIAKNKRNTIIIIAGFILLIGMIGAGFAYLNDNWAIAIYALVIASVYALFQYFIASKLLVVMTGAKPIVKKDHPRLYNIVENLSITTGLPMPKVYIIEDPAPNAFASGKDPEHSIVAATTGLIDLMDDKELTAVMAHEMSHIKNYDIRVSLIVFSLVAAVGLIADIGSRIFFYSKDDDERSPVGVLIVLIVSLLAPFVATLARLAVSRQREYLADASAAHITRYPEGMISALKKLATHGRPMHRQNSAAASMFIYNPMRSNFVSNLFSTHPPIESRIKQLEHAKTTF